MKKKKTDKPYPWMDRMGIPVNTDGEHEGVDPVGLNETLERNGLSVREFSVLFGIQTMGPLGMFPWDVEAVLERMMSGKRTGTQLFWD